MPLTGVSPAERGRIERRPLNLPPSVFTPHLLRPEGVDPAEADRGGHGPVAPAVEDGLHLEVFARGALGAHPVEVVGIRDTK